MTSSNKENENNPQKDKNFKKNFPGTVITFKQYLPIRNKYYDSLPVVLGVRIIGDKIFGINLKLIPFRFRLKLLKELSEPNRKDKKTNKIRVTDLIKGKYGKFLAAAFEVYRLRNIKGKIVILEEMQWLLASTDSYNSFKNIKKNVLNNIIKERAFSIINPMKYIITIIKNTIRKKYGNSSK